MFKIKYRIVDDIETLKHISINDFDNERGQIIGYIQLCFGENIEGGYYHEGELHKDESGDELLEYWIGSLLDVIVSLQENDFVGFYQIETFDKWMVFKKVGDKVIINAARDITNEVSDLYITIEPDTFKYIYEDGYAVEYLDFCKEIKRVGNQFVRELYQLNPNLLKTKMYSFMDTTFIDKYE